MVFMTKLLDINDLEKENAYRHYNENFFFWKLKEEATILSEGRGIGFNSIKGQSREDNDTNTVCLFDCEAGIQSDYYQINKKKFYI